LVNDQLHMARALALAARGRGRTSPNPLVGAVVASDDGVVLGWGFHERAGSPHAEIHALAAAGGRARGATLYCTLEPCCHTGRTGPCVERIAEAGISRVVASIEDPNPLVSGKGFQYLRDRGIAVEVGVNHADAERLNAPFLTFIRHRRPFVIMKIATSLDGRIGIRGEATRLTSALARRRAQMIRAEVDAIGVGSETVLVDDPLLTVREVWRERPLTRVIFDRRLRTPPSARLWSTLGAGPVIIVTTESAVAAASSRAHQLIEKGAALEALDARGEETGGSLSDGLTRLASRGVTSLLLEGGAALHASAWRAGLVDRVQVFVSPRVLGEAGIPWLASDDFSLDSLTGVRTEPCGDDLFIEGDVHRAD
jgi:diaminohydroxyphosphoribosylaminopyrimidine deaminase/5-amino-6-(5-phosphoribosylamino)uracil reductase